MSDCLSVYLSLCFTVCVSVYPSACLTACLSTCRICVHMCNLYSKNEQVNFEDLTYHCLFTLFYYSEMFNLMKTRHTFFLHSVISLTEYIGIVRVGKYRVVCLSVCVCVSVFVSPFVCVFVCPCLYCISLSVSVNACVSLAHSVSVCLYSSLCLLVCLLAGWLAL